MAYRLDSSSLGKPGIRKAMNDSAAVNDRQVLYLAFSSLLALEWIECLENVVLLHLPKDEAESVLRTAVLSAREAALRTLDGNERDLFRDWLDSEGIRAP